MTSRPAPVTLSAPLDLTFLPLVTGFAEQAAAAFGLGRDQGLQLTLAAEEIISYLGRFSDPGENVRVEAEGGGHYVELKFFLPRRDVDLRAFNLTASLSPDRQADLDELGLLIASRSVERFYVFDAPEAGLGLVLIKEKAYPQAIEPPPIGPLAEYDVGPARPEDLKLLAGLIGAHYPAGIFPPGLDVPGRLVDMVAGGNYGAAVGRGRSGADRDLIGGGIVWHWQSERTVACFGPYLFNQADDSDLGAALVEACLAAIAKTEAVGLFCLLATPQMPSGYFETLGELDLVDPDGGRETRPCYWRQLHEDPGARVWCHPRLEEWLTRTYQGLFLARGLRLTRHEGEGRPPHSVLGADFNRPAGTVILRPVLDGEDVALNLARHVELLAGEKVPNVLFEIDLDRAWQADLTPVLLDGGFRPRLVLPQGGRSDLVIFQLVKG